MRYWRQIQICKSIKDQKKGYTMVVVLCILGLLVVLSLGVVFAAALSVKRAEKQRDQEQCRILAQSFSQMLDKEVEDTKSWLNREIYSLISQREGEPWKPYDPGNLTTVKNIHTEVLNEENDSLLETGDISMSMYWEPMEEEEEYWKSNLTIAVKCTFNKHTYVLQNIYTSWDTEQAESELNLEKNSMKQDITQQDWNGGWYLQGRYSG